MPRFIQDFSVAHALRTDRGCDPNFYNELSPAVEILSVFREDPISQIKSRQFAGDHQGAFVLTEKMLLDTTDPKVRQRALELKHAMIYDAGQHEEAIDVLDQIRDEYLLEEDFYNAAETTRRIGRSYRDIAAQNPQDIGSRNAALREYAQAADLFATAYEHKRIAAIDDSDSAFANPSDIDALGRINVRYLETLREHLYAVPRLFPAAEQLFRRLEEAKKIHRKSQEFRAVGSSSEWQQKQQIEIVDRLQEMETAARTRKRFGSRMLAQIIEA